MFVEQAGNVLEKNADFVTRPATGGDAGVLFQLPRLRAFRFADVAPQLREQPEDALARAFPAAQHGGRQARRKHDPDGAGQDEKRRCAVIAFAHHDFTGPVFLNGSIVAENAAQRHVPGEVFRIHPRERRDGQQSVHVRLGHLGVKRRIPALGPIQG